MKKTTFDEAYGIMGDNIIGPDELSIIDNMQFTLDGVKPFIPFEKREIEKKKDEYLLIYAADRFGNKKSVTIRNMKETLGENPNQYEPCFYNQDWYENEKFIDVKISEGWFFIRRELYEESRAVIPEKLNRIYVFPSAIECTYAFFVAWLTRGIKLWENDFVWCSDRDHNGDRIYVGRYYDEDGINKNGFNIHRHLGLRNCYGCID